MKILTLLTTLIIAVNAVNAGHISMSFRGLDEKYTFTPYAISTLRESIACRAGLNHSLVVLNSITIRNRTFEFDVNDEVNSYSRVMPYNCYFLNSVHWDNHPIRISQNLLQELKDDIEVTFKIEFPGDAKKAYGANIMSFLATAVNEYYANILENDYMLFYTGSMPELIRHNVHHGVFNESDHNILMYMFLVQIALVFIGNMVLNKLKKRVPPLSPAAFRNKAYDPVYVVVK
jgi:hypothetical protein